MVQHRHLENAACNADFWDRSVAAFLTTELEFGGFF
jgi:hypothetical protein